MIDREKLKLRLTELYQQKITKPKIAEILNAEGYTTFRGLPFTEIGVRNYLDSLKISRRDRLKAALARPQPKSEMITLTEAQEPAPKSKLMVIIGDRIEIGEMIKQGVI